MVSSMRIELDETALVRPSNEASARGRGSAGSTTIADSPLESSAEASARPTNPPPKMITSARSIAGAPTPFVATAPRPRLTRESAWGILWPSFWGWDMATVATRAPKRELAPDWRDALREAVRRFAVRSSGVLLVGLGSAGAVALATHNPNDPSLSTAAGGPPTNWLGTFGAYLSDGLLLLFGLGSALFLPVIAIAGLRMIRLEPAGRIGRGLVVAAVGAVFLGIALGLTSASAVSGLPAGWGGALGLAAAHGVNAGLGLISNPQIAGPVRLAALLILALVGLGLGYLALGLSPGERAWISRAFRREPGERRAAPRRTEIRDDRPVVAAPPKGRPMVAVTEPARTPAPAG